MKRILKPNQVIRNKKGQIIGTVPRSRIIKNCLKCGKEFQTVENKVRAGKGKYCSKDCFYAMGVSQKTREIWSQIRKGKRPSPGTEFKKGDKRTIGENNTNWKGGITPENMKIRQSQEYKDWRTAVFKRDDYTCQECKSRGYKLHADHIKPFAYFPELRLVIDNGRTLCVPCHRKTSTFSLGARKIYGRIKKI